IRRLMRMDIRKLSVWLLAAGSMIGIAGVQSAHAQYHGAPPSANPNNNPLAPPPLPFWRVRNSRVFLIPGAGANGANVAVQGGRDGVAMVDTCSVENADKVLATVKFLENYENSIPQPLGYASETRSMVNFNRVPPAQGTRLVINTNVAPEHIGGNEKITASGVQ